jgi:alkylhydroperoxidase/carboxymuconolactone decarboxylase family protein YurZ
MEKPTIRKERKMARSRYVTEKQAKGRVKEIFGELKEKKGRVPKLYMALAKDPEYLEAFYNKRNTVLRPGKLDMLTKEIIAYVVSVVHNCPT